ncbi:MAG TPA: hypothetical protein VM070_05400, partial [Candidatus Saccharimonadales bacterium]|nr:hypothetical protein [Candidatus Saccharimonadales bacterium]
AVIVGQRRSLFPIAAAATAFSLAVGFPAADPDTYWHLASGQWMIEHREILRADVFSATIAGRSYALGEWLGEVVLAAAFGVGGWPGLVLLRSTLVAIAAFCAARIARRGGGSAAAAAIVLGVGFVATRSRWIDRPALFTFVLFAVVLDLLFAARAGSRRALIAVPPLLLLWANLHGGYVVGLALVGAFAAEALLLRRPVARAFLLVLALSTIVTFADPETFGLGGAAGHALAPPRFIREEAPPDVLEASGAVFALFLAGVLGVAILRGAGLLQVLLLAPLIWLALSGQRHLAFFLIAALPLLADGLAAPLHVATRWVASRALSRYRPPASAAALGVAALVIAAVASAVAVPTGPDERRYPVGALPALASGSGLVLNEYDWGGFLILRAPGRPVFIDGRLFPFESAGVLEAYREAVELRPGWREVLDRYAVRQVLLRPDRPLTVALRDSGWTVQAEDAQFVLLGRP